MKTINFRASKPSVIWNEILDFFGIGDSQRTHFQLPENLGSGTISFSKVALDLNHFEFRIRLKEDIAVHFERSNLSDEYEILAFFHGSRRAIALDYPQDPSVIKPVIKKSGENAQVFLSLISHYSHLPSFKFRAGEVCRVNFLFISKEWLSAVLPEDLFAPDSDPLLFTENPSPLLISGDKTVDFNELFFLLKRFNETKSNEKLVILGQLYQMLGDYFSLLTLLKKDIDVVTERINEEDLKKIHQLESLIKKHDSSILPSLSQLAKTVGLSKTKMCILFKKVYSESISAYHGLLKLKKAKELLANSKENIGQIGERLAIGNKSYFTRWFKNLTGMSPTAFRENSLKGV